MSPRMGAIPEVGSQTDQILAELGYAPEEVSRLRAAGAV
jgi:crotonobetainyl-CoA:carnitine CoA-transferase CaiB-like acyl-CoA transferase